jgi:hypothetical protein
MTCLARVTLALFPIRSIVQLSSCPRPRIPFPCDTHQGYRPIHIKGDHRIRYDRHSPAYIGLCLPPTSLLIKLGIPDPTIARTKRIGIQDHIEGNRRGRDRRRRRCGGCRRDDEARRGRRRARGEGRAGSRCSGRRSRGRHGCKCPRGRGPGRSCDLDNKRGRLNRRCAPASRSKN